MGSSSNTLPMFFKVFQSYYASQNLMIPVVFEDRITHEIPSRVFLATRNRSWLVNVVSIGGKLYFEEGWSKFALDNSMSYGEFMVFRYNGQRIFDVLLLGRNGCVKKLEEMEVGGRIIRDENVNVEEEDEEMFNTMSSTNSSKDYWSDKDESEDDDYRHSKKFRKITSKKNGRNARGNKNVSSAPVRNKKVSAHITKYLPKENPFFITKIKKSAMDNNRVLIPRGTLMQSHLKLCDEVGFLDDNGKWWMGKKCLWTNGQTWVIGWWKRMCTIYNVEEGDNIICEFLPLIDKTCNTIKVRVVKP